jgi:ESF2/ABP1 family protein
VCLSYSALNAAYKKAIREQKLAIEISAAKRERDFYLKKVDQSRALSSIEERMKKVNSIYNFSLLQTFFFLEPPSMVLF